MTLDPKKTLDPKETAVVVIEFQNDFTSEGGVMHDAVAPVMDETGMADKIPEAVAKARAAGATIVHIPIAFASGYGELAPNPYGILAGVVAHEAFVKGSWGAEIDARVAPEKGDIIVQGKLGLDPFHSTNLDFILRSRGVKHVALAGFLTNVCVESTMRSAYEKGFQVYTLTDCMAATSPEEHKNAISTNFPMFSHTIKAEDFVSSLVGADEMAGATNS